MATQKAFTTGSQVEVRDQRHVTDGAKGLYVRGGANGRSIVTIDGYEQSVLTSNVYGQGHEYTGPIVHFQPQTVKATMHEVTVQENTYRKQTKRGGHGAIASLGTVVLTIRNLDMFGGEEVVKVQMDRNELLAALVEAHK